MFSHVHRRDGRSRLSDARGETLVEVLITIVLLGIGFTAILAGIITAVRVADRNQQRTRASTAVQGWAESLLQPALPIPAVTTAGQVPQVNFTTYTACAGVGAYGAPPSGALPSGYTATITGVRYLMGYASGLPLWTSNQTTCYNSYYKQKTTNDAQGVTKPYFVDNGLQELTLRVDSGVRANGRFVDTLVIVKRDQRCPGTFDNADLGPC